MTALEAERIDVDWEKKIFISRQGIPGWVIGGAIHEIQATNQEDLSPFSRLSALRALRSVCAQIAFLMVDRIRYRPWRRLHIHSILQRRICLFDGLRKSSSPPATQFGSGFLFPGQPPISLRSMIFTSRFQAESHTPARSIIHPHRRPSTPPFSPSSRYHKSHPVTSRSHIALHGMTSA